MRLALFSTLIFLSLSLIGCKEEEERHQPAAPPAAEATPPGPAPGPLLLLGADALDMKVLRRLLRKDRLPNFARLLEQGASGILLSEREIRSPAIWTTIATGRPRDVHGIYDFVTGSRLWPKHLRSEDKRLVTSKMRRVDAVWNWATTEDKKVAVVGWLNTWPAETVNGTMVSPYVAIGRAKQITIKGNVYPDEPYQVHPKERWSEVRALLSTPDEVPPELVDSFVDPVDAAVQRDLPMLDRLMDGLRWSLSHTLTMKEITLHLMEQDSPDLTMVFFEGADSLGHRFWLFRRSLGKVEAQLAEAGLPTDHAEALREAYGDVIYRYYELLDETLGELWRALPDKGRLLVVSDHGFGDLSGRYKLDASTPFTGEHRLEGAILAAGPDIRAGTTVYGATIYDVTPTMVDLLGLEVEVPFEGKSLLDQLTREVERSPEPSPEQAGSESDDESFRAQEMERLRSLGYVQ